MNPLYRNESVEHIKLKLEAAHRLSKAGFTVFPELGRCDVFGYKLRPDGSTCTVAVEVQVTPKHTFHNIHRNLNNNILRVCVIATSKSAKQAILRKLAKSKFNFGHRVSVVTLEGLNQNNK